MYRNCDQREIYSGQDNKVIIIVILKSS